VNENEPKHKCEYFIPKKRVGSKDFKITDHAVKRYVERFGGNGNVRTVIKSALDNGEDILYHSEGNQVIHHKGVFYVVKDSEVKTVYTRTIYVEARPRIVRGWEADSNGK